MTEIFIDGQWLAAQSGGQREIRCPADGRMVEVEVTSPVLYDPEGSRRDG